MTAGAPPTQMDPRRPARRRSGHARRAAGGDCKPRRCSTGARPGPPARPHRPRLAARRGNGPARRASGPAARAAAPTARHTVCSPDAGRRRARLDPPGSTGRPTHTNPTAAGGARHPACVDAPCAGAAADGARRDGRPPRVPKVESGAVGHQPVSRRWATVATIWVASPPRWGRAQRGTPTFSMALAGPIPPGGGSSASVSTAALLHLCPCQRPLRPSRARQLAAAAARRQRQRHVRAAPRGSVVGGELGAL